MKTASNGSFLYEKSRIIDFYSVLKISTSLEL